MVAISVHCWYSFSADNILENAPPLRHTTHANLGQGGRSAQMQKTTEAIMWRKLHLLIYQRTYWTIPWQLLQKPIVRYLFINTMYQCSSWPLYRRMIAMLFPSFWYLRVLNLHSWTGDQTHASQVLKGIALGFRHQYRSLPLIRTRCLPYLFRLIQVYYLLLIAQGVAMKSDHKMLMLFHLNLVKTKMQSLKFSMQMEIWVCTTLSTLHTFVIKLLSRSWWIITQWRWAYSFCCLMKDNWDETKDNSYWTL